MYDTEKQNRQQEGDGTPHRRPGGRRSRFAALLILIFMAAGVYLIAALFDSAWVGVSGRRMGAGLRSIWGGAVLVPLLFWLYLCLAWLVRSRVPRPVGQILGTVQLYVSLAFMLGLARYVGWNPGMNIFEPGVIGSAMAQFFVLNLGAVGAAVAAAASFLLSAFFFGSRIFTLFMSSLPWGKAEEGEAEDASAPSASAQQAAARSEVYAEKVGKIHPTHDALPTDVPQKEQQTNQGFPPPPFSPSPAAQPQQRPQPQPQQKPQQEQKFQAVTAAPFAGNSSRPMPNAEKGFMPMPPAGNGSMPTPNAGNRPMPPAGNEPAAPAGNGFAPNAGNSSRPIPNAGKGFMPMPPAGNGAMPPAGNGFASNAGNGSMPMPPAGNGFMPTPNAGKGFMPMPPAGDGSRPMPPAGNGFMPMPPAGKGPAAPAGNGFMPNAGNRPMPQAGKGPATPAGKGFMPMPPAGNGFAPRAMNEPVIPEESEPLTPKIPLSEPEALRPEPEAFRPEPGAPWREPEAPRPEPEVPQPEPEALRPEPEAPQPEPEAPSRREPEAPQPEPLLAPGGILGPDVAASQKSAVEILDNLLSSLEAGAFSMPDGLLKPSPSEVFAEFTAPAVSAEPAAPDAPDDPVGDVEPDAPAVSAAPDPIPHEGQQKPQAPQVVPSEREAVDEPKEEFPVFAIHHAAPSPAEPEDTNIQAAVHEQKPEFLPEPEQKPEFEKKTEFELEQKPEFLQKLDLEQKPEQNPEPQRAGDGKDTAVQAAMPEVVMPDEVEEPRSLEGIFPPPLDIFGAPAQDAMDREAMAQADRQGEIIVETLKNFGVSASVANIVIGPSVVQFQLELAPGTKVNKVAGLANDLTMALAVISVRVEAPILGQHYVGIEIPNAKRRGIPMRLAMESPEFVESSAVLPMPMGMQVDSKFMVCGLEDMPHLLVAGTTGSGKSVFVNACILGMCYRRMPGELKLILVDPKHVEFAIYDGLPHLLARPISDSRKAIDALTWAVQEMESRTESFARARVRSLAPYNEKVLPKDRLPHIVVVVDELADLMYTAGKEVEGLIARLAQKSRAAGIHLILATQRPSVDVITGLIKANVPARVAFAVPSQTDSRTIIDAAGADKLLGKGDMLFLSSRFPRPLRLQSPFITEERTLDFVEYMKGVFGEPDYIEFADSGGGDGGVRGGNGAVDDPRMEDAIRTVMETGITSASGLQRLLSIGYPKAGRLITAMERLGILGPQIPNSTKPRQILLDEESAFEALERARTGGIFDDD